MSAQPFHDGRAFPSVKRVLRPNDEYLMRQLLGELEDLGYLLTAPGGEQPRDYVNVTPMRRRGRVLSIHAATGRSEFQTNSWNRIGHLSPRFERLAGGNKAPHPESLSDLRAIVEVGRVELGFRGGVRSPHNRRRRPS